MSEEVNNRQPATGMNGASEHEEGHRGHHSILPALGLDTLRVQIYLTFPLTRSTKEKIMITFPDDRATSRVCRECGMSFTCWTVTFLRQLQRASHYLHQSRSHTRLLHARLFLPYLCGCSCNRVK